MTLRGRLKIAMSQVIDRTDHATDQMESFIKFYRSQNLNIIPVRYRDKAPIGEWKRYQSEAMSEEEIQRTFLSGAAVNIAVVCGAISDNLLVLDFDNKEIYNKRFRFFEKETLVIQTARGVQIYLKSSYPVRGFKIPELQVDAKGEGGYVVAPPSIHPSGKIYQIISDLPIKRIEGDFKQELFEILKLKEAGEEIDVTKLLEGVQEGQRDEAAIRIATWFRKQGMSQAQIEGEMRKWNLKNTPPLDEAQLLKCIDSAFKRTEPYNYRFKVTQIQQELTPEIEAFLKDPDLHSKVRKTLDFTIVGEPHLKLLYYYASIGAALTKTPFGIVTKDVCGAGKSYTEREILKVFPPERVFQPTSITDKVVNYLGGNYAGKIVRIDEIYKKAPKEGETEEGMSYIRMWMSEGRLEHWRTDPDSATAQRIVTEGCPFFLTSTTYDIEEQYGSRNYIAHIDTSPEQTQQIHRHQDLMDSVPGIIWQDEETALRFMVDVSRWLLQNAKPVLIPQRFSFPSHDPRQRREKPKFKHLIRCISCVHQLQRKHVKIGDVEYIISERRDFEIALEVYKDYLRSSMTSLDKYELQILQLMSREPDKQWKIKEIHAELAKTIKGEVTVRRKLTNLSKYGYVIMDLDESVISGRRPYVYIIAPRGIELQSVFDIKIVDERKELLEIYERLAKGEDPSKVKADFLSLLSQEKDGQISDRDPTEDRGARDRNDGTGQGEPTDSPEVPNNWIQRAMDQSDEHIDHDKLDSTKHQPEEERKEERES